MSDVPVHFVPSFHFGSGASAGDEAVLPSGDVDPASERGPSGDDGDDDEPEADGSGEGEVEGDDDDGADEHAAINAAEARSHTTAGSTRLWKTSPSASPA